MPDAPRRLNPFYYLTVAACALFVMTILALVAAVFGNQAAPAARFLNDYAGMLIAAEVALTLVIGLLALVVDRRSSRQGGSSADPSSTSATESPPRPLSPGDEDAV